MARDRSRVPRCRESEIATGPLTTRRTRLRVPGRCVRRCGETPPCGWRQMHIARLPQVRAESAARRLAKGSETPGGRSRATRFLPLGRGGHRPLALAWSPGQENHWLGRAGKVRWVASGQGRRIDFQSQKDTPIPPRLVWKSSGAKAGGSEVFSFPVLTGGRNQHSLVAAWTVCDIRHSRAFWSLAEREGCLQSYTIS